MFSPVLLAQAAQKHWWGFHCMRCEVSWAKAAGQHCWMCGRFGKKKG